MLKRVAFMPLLLAVIFIGAGAKAVSIWWDISAVDSPAAYAFQADAQNDADTSQTEAASQEARDDEITRQASATVRAPRDLDALNRTEFELLQELRSRREALDKRERQIDLQQTVLDAKGRQIDQKIVRLEALETSIKGLISEYNTQEDQRLKGLVQIYETMKPKDAANIFDRLELDTQLDLATRINPRKFSSILAEMAPDSAKVLTTELAKRDPLPNEIPDQAS